MPSLAEASEREYDVCVIGGGATGAGCALDAQLRGFSAILIEANDFASGASSASTKLVHGGVRYLRDAVLRLRLGQFKVVAEALRERAILIGNAPHLAHSLRIAIPCVSKSERAYYTFGMRLYDWISGKASLGNSTVLCRRETLRRLPVLKGASLSFEGAVEFADGQFDDARYNLAVVRTFANEGGTIFNHCRVTEFERNAAGKLIAAKVMNALSGETAWIRAKRFINATGPCADSVRQLANAALLPRMRPSKGVHLLFPLGQFEGQPALMIPKTEDGRLVFAIPWQGRLLVGTTDTQCNPETDGWVLREEAEYLLRQVNPYLGTPLRIEDIVSAMAGLRPLVGAAGAGHSKQLVREHEVEVDSQSGLISILGGKWTTYRAMAQQTVDEVERQLRGRVGTCKTSEFPLAGADDRGVHRVNPPGKWVSEAAQARLSERYGSLAHEVMALITERPELAQPLVEGIAALKAEVVYAIRCEWARTLEDVLRRRLGIELYSWRLAIQAAPATAELVGGELGWSAAQQSQAVLDYVGRIERNLDLLGLTTE